ncbi:MAG: single-stranded DNA-binding protein [Planctomycetes bacterium]|nr:single-stranded DNA-binding protein [Planctomycetota bacterium]
MSDGRPVVVVGRLMNDPKLRRSGTEGTPFLKMRLAIWRCGEGERTATVGVGVRGQLAEICAQNLRRGRTVAMAGLSRVQPSNEANGTVCARFEVLESARGTQVGKMILISKTSD